MTRRLLFSYLGLTVLILVILEVPLGTLGQRFERDLATSQAVREASGLVAVITEPIEERQPGTIQSLVSSYAARTGGEVIVVDSSMHTVALSTKDTDNDATNDWRSLTERALQNQSASAFTSDEGRSFAVAAIPISGDSRTLGAVVFGAPASGSENRIHEVWLALAVFAAVALVVAGVVGILLARSLARPVADLEAAVGRLGQGDLASRAVEGEGPPEIRSLAHRFNVMADRINDLVVAQRRFVAEASHQLRSPLTALRLRIDNLASPSGEHRSEAAAAVGSEEAAAVGSEVTRAVRSESLAAVTRELDRLSRIVDGLLALGRADQERPEKARVSLSQVVTDRCDAWGALAAERNVRLDLADHHNDIVSMLVPGDLEQILDNILANAMEVSPAGSRIDVGLVRQGREAAVVRISDQGPGMTAEERNRAFDRFWQGANGTGRSGLGLAIVSQLAARNEMSVDLEAAEPNGLSVVIRAPVLRGAK